MSAPRTARARVRDEVTREILDTARTHLAREGAAALSLRSIARDLEMAPSALYRYFSGRDAVLSALILGAYETLADDAVAASTAAYDTPGSAGERWPAVPRAMRGWALVHPHEWGLVFGSPVPGYEAPAETVVPYTRLAEALARPVAEAERHGDLRSTAGPVTERTALEAALAPVREAILPGSGISTVAAALRAWSTLIGMISLELFGHWRNTVLDPAVLFEETVAQLGRSIGLPP